MLLNKIELKGFLSYYGQENGTGDIEPVIIDFRHSPLWLVHGKNGTGKTSLFDAISFALYDKHRGSGTENNTANCLIHHLAAKAEINLEIEIEGQSYLIQRTITRTRRKNKGQYTEGSKLWGIVRRGSDINSPAIPDTEKNVATWVEKHLRMSYETFVSSVLLRQGEADAFLKTKPTKRKERLLEVLDLEFYKKLGDRATQKSNEYKKEQKRIQQELEQLNKVTDKEIKAKEEIIEKHKKVLARTKERERNKQQEKNNAINAKSYQQQILKRQEQQKQYQTLIEKQESIIQNAREYREINDAVKQLNILWEKRYRSNEETTAIQQTEAKLEKSQVEVDRLSSELEQAKQKENKKSEEVELNKRQLEQYEERHDQLSHQLKDLEQVKRLEEQIEQLEKQLKPHLEILRDSQKIESKYQRYKELSVKVPLLQKLSNAQQELKKSEVKFEKSETAVNNYEQQFKIAKKEETKLKKQKDSLDNEIEKIQKDSQSYQNKILNLQEKLEHRESVSHAQECPTCGSHLDNSEVQERLEQECQFWEEKVAILEQQRVNISNRSEKLEKSQSIIEERLQIVNERNNELNTELTRAKVNLEYLQNTVKDNQQTVDLVLKEAGKWKEDSDRLRELEIELESLNDISEQKQKLEHAKFAKSTIKPNLDSYDIELKKLPTFSVEEREQLNSEQENITQLINDSETKQQAIESELKQAQSVSQKLDHQKIARKIEIRSDENKLKDLQQRKKKIIEEIAEYQKSFSFQWKNHPACENKVALEQLRQRLNNLSDAEAEEQKLQEAQIHFSKIAGEISTLQTLLKKIPVKHYPSTDDIENELKEIISNLEQIEEQIESEKTALIQMQSERQQYEAKDDELININKECNYYKQLANTFGAKGLQAQIIQAAQEKIKLNANNTLARLSNGRWQIDLKENNEGTELYIVTRDLSQLTTPVRQFEYLSSGEKFIVAISLAVSIGQSIYAGRTVDSLVIDEGFGSLDDDKRPLMVNELKRLSEDILQGGRVIVVSHQNDVCESFDSRYHVYRDERNYAQVKQYISVPL